MHTSTADLSTTASGPLAPARRHSPAAVALRPGFWRIVHPSGAVLGYIERSVVDEHGFTGEPFRARRLIAGTTRMIEIGEFWSLDDATACFGY